MNRNPPSKKIKAVAPDQENTASKNTASLNHTSLSAASTASCILWRRSNSAEDRRTRVLELLGICRQTTYNLRAKDISHSGARVKELRKLGHSISTARVTAVDSDGYLHASVALYVLEKAGINLMQADMFATNAAMDKVVDA